MCLLLRMIELPLLCSLLEMQLLPVLCAVEPREYGDSFEWLTAQLDMVFCRSASANDIATSFETRIVFGGVGW